MAKYKYVDQTKFYPGIPARDLTSEEVEAMTDEQKDALKIAVSEGVYQDTKSADKKFAAE